MSSIEILVIFINSNYKQFFVVNTNTSVGELRKKISDSLQIGNPFKLLLYDMFATREFLVFDKDIVYEKSKITSLNIDGQKKNAIILYAVLIDGPLPSLDHNIDKFYLPYGNVVDEQGNIKSGFSAVPIPSSLLTSITSAPTTSIITSVSSNSSNNSSYTTYIITIIVLVLCILAYRMYKK